LPVPRLRAAPISWARQAVAPPPQVRTAQDSTVPAQAEPTAEQPQAELTAQQPQADPRPAASARSDSSVEPPLPAGHLPAIHHPE
jgi:hypothetical protein